MSSKFLEWQKEKEFLEKEKEAHPELFERSIAVDDDAVLRSVGIGGVFGERVLGHIKLFPEDFIVEEVSKDQKLHTVEDEPAIHMSATEEVRTIWADLVKMGIDTIEAVNEISRQLGIDKKFIGVAGIKDKYALTSQAISFRSVAPESVISVNAPNFFLKNVSLGKGALQVGDLLGNRFTIFIRTKGQVDELELKNKLRELEEDGFWNFFYLQRFGTPRLISHKLGLLILQGKFEDTVKASLTYASEREIPYFKNYRARLLESWGDWEKLLQETEPLAYSFSTERRMIEYLVAHPTDFIGALNQVPEQIKLWAYAYASYLFNKTLSRFIQKGDEVPFKLPLAFGRDPRIGEFYGDFFRAHKIAPPFPVLKNFPYIQKAEKEVETLKKLTLHGVRVVPEGVVLDFFLEKASYATTFLSHIFILSSGQPVPEGISVEEIDSKKLLGTGTVGPLKTGKFRELFEMRKEPPLVQEEIS